MEPELVLNYRGWKGKVLLCHLILDIFHIFFPVFSVGLLLEQQQMMFLLSSFTLNLLLPLDFPCERLTVCRLPLSPLIQWRCDFF